MKRIFVVHKLVLFMLLLVVVVFIGGTGFGYYVLPRFNNQEKATMPTTRSLITNKQTKNSDTDGNVGIKKDDITLKLSILKDYTNFVYMPTEKIGDVSQYIARMDEKVVMLDNPVMEEKYYATGEGSPEEREQKVLTFFNFILDEVINDVNNAK